MAITDNLISYWKLDEASGNAADSVNANTGVNTGTTTYGTGQINNGLTPSAATGKVLNCGHNANLGDANGISISLWFKTSTATGYFITKEANNSGGTWYLGLGNIGGATSSDGKLVFLPFATTIYKSTATYNDNAWHHVVATYDKSNVIIYVDGSSVSTTAASTAIPVNAGSDVVINYRGTYSSYSYAGYGGIIGTMDEIGLWIGRAITSTEVTTLWNSGAGIQYPFIASGPANMKSFNGLVKASIKSINGLAIGSTKSVNGLA